MAWQVGAVWRGYGAGTAPSPWDLCLRRYRPCPPRRKLPCRLCSVVLQLAVPTRITAATPQPPRAPAPVAVSALPCAEHDGFVWVWPGWEEPTLPLPTFTRPPPGYRIHTGQRNGT